MNKKVPLWLVLLLVWIFALTALLFGWAVWYTYEGGHLISDKTKKVIISVARFPSLVEASIKQVINPPPLIRRDRYPDLNGLKLEDKQYTDSSYLLLAAYDKKTEQSAVKLIRLSDQKILHEWIPDMDAVIKIRDKDRKFSESSNKGNIVVTHPLLGPDGSIVFNTEDHPLMKIDKDSKLLWSLEGVFHHSQEYDADGNIWASYTIESPPFMPQFFRDYRNDAIAKVSPDGKFLFRKSISDILLENGYRGLLFGIGPMEPDILHLNDIQPALASSEYWQKGDLLISIRNKSTVFLYRPSENKILWLKTGPWLNQHDANFIDDSRIAIFGNNIIRNKNYDYIDGYNEVYIYDFRTNEVKTPYTNFLKKAKVRTMTGGRASILSNGDVFIEETDFGRLLRGNSENIIWQYVERVDERSVGMLGWSNIITPNEFKQYDFLKDLQK